MNLKSNEFERLPTNEKCFFSITLIPFLCQNSVASFSIFWLKIIFF